MIQTQLRRRTAPERDNTAAQARLAGPGALPEAALDTGHRTDLPGEIREKMESAFGADFSGVKLYESQAVADAGADAVTQGSAIAFAPGKLDLTSTSGQALLGHELSHVVSQARGESAGQGFLNDPRLEAQADRQGMMAARGESVFAGPVSPIGASSTVSASGPIQAKKHEEKADIQMERQGMQGNARDLGYFARKKLAREYDAEEQRRKSLNMPTSGDTTKNLPEIMTRERAQTPQEIQEAVRMELLMRNNSPKMAELSTLTHESNNPTWDTPEAVAFKQWLDEEFELKKSGHKEKYEDSLKIRTNRGADTGIGIDRVGMYLWNRGKKAGMEDDEIQQMMKDLMLNSRNGVESTEEERGRSGEALKKMKGLFYGALTDVRDKYGTMMTQLHPEDAFNQSRDFWKDTTMSQDSMLLFERAPELFDPDSAEDREYGDLNQYIMAAQSLMQNYTTFADARAQGTADVGRDQSPANILRHNLNVAKMHEANVLAHNPGGTPHMGPKELRAYRRRAKQKYGTMGISNFFENEDESVDMAALGQVPAPRSDNPLRRILTIEDTHRGLH